MLKYIFATIFVALAWALVLVFRDTLPMWPAVAVTVVIVLLLVALAVFKILAARKAAAAIESGLRDQAARGNEGMRPDLAAEIAAMEAEFDKAVGALKGSKLGRSGRDALGLLPWYVMIGPSASGKTTAIRSSGLKLPYGKGGKVRGVGGTRNCDWWMTNDAILLDTAGRWSTDDDDREEWLAFLDLLKKTRPRKPINGILLAVAATDLQKSEEEIHELAGRLRERIDEVITRLEVIVPVYLMVTKCDLISGFVEAFGDLKDRERGQIWGFSLPLISEGADRVETLAQHFDDLTDVLERQALVRMGEERRVDARERIYLFPQQFDSLRQGLIDLTANLFDQSVYQDAPIMRGVYFTSGTQEGRPVDRIMANMAEAFGVRPRIVAAAPTKPKSYFVKDVFQRVVFPDKDVAVRNARVLKRERTMRWVTAAVTLAVSAALLFVPITSYLANKQFVADTRGYVEKLVHAREDRPARGVLAGAGMESAEPMAERLADFALKGPDVSLQVAGLYPGDRLMEAVQLAVERLVVRPLLDNDVSQLQAFARGHSDITGPAATNALRLHLLLTQPKAGDEPSPQGDGWRDRWVGVAGQTAADRFAAVTGAAATTRARQAVDWSVRYYALRIKTVDELIERKTDAVSHTRTALLGAGDGDPLAELVADPSMPRDLHLIDIVAGKVTMFQGGDDRRNSSMVPGAYTPAGWTAAKARIARLNAASEHDEDAWVLGVSRKRGAVDAGALQVSYFSHYVEAWKRFLLALTIKEPTNIDDVRGMLKSFMMDKPLESIWHNAKTNLVFKDDSPLDMIPKKLKGGLQQKIDDIKKKIGGDDQADDSKKPGGGKPRNEEPTSPEDVGREFTTFLNFGLTKPSGLDEYAKVLAEVAGAVGDAGAPEPRAFQSVIRAQRVKLQGLINSYNENGWEAGMLEKILMPPLLGAEIAVMGATGDSANRKWCDSIVVVYDQLLAGKYPFYLGKGARDVPRDVRVADVEKFFQPKTGTLWQYFSEALQADIDHPAGTTVFHIKDQPSVKYKPNLVAFLKKSQELTDLLYAKDPTKLGLTVSIRIRPSAPYTKIVFELGGKKVTYFNTKERWDEVTWPGRGALFHFFQKSGDGEIGYTDGEWGLFHLLEAGKLTTTSDGEEYLAGSWMPPVGEGAIRADVKPAALVRAFRGFDIPRSIVAGSAGCR